MKIFYCFLLITLIGCGHGGVMVTEMEKNRTHVFEHYTDGTRTMLNGEFNFDGKLWPGSILYDGEKSYLFRPSPNQCLIFPNNKVIYGFLPINIIEDKKYGDDTKVVIINKDGKNKPTKYHIVTNGKNSIVEFNNLEKSYDSDDDRYELPENTTCVEYENYVLNVK